MVKARSPLNYALPQVIGSVLLSRAEPIDDDPTRPYYESWTAALTDLVVDLDLAGTDEVNARAAHVGA